MSKSTIEWTDETHNPGIYGCSHYGSGCTNCYAERMAQRLSNMGQVGYQGSTENWRWTRKVFTVSALAAAQSILDLPRRRSVRPVRTFVTSMGDMLHESIDVAWTAKVIEAMAYRPDRIFQVLTHRGWRWPDVVAAVMDMHGSWPSNVWAGVSASTQAEVDREIPGLLRVPGVRFLSLEPLLGLVDLDKLWCHNCDTDEHVVFEPPAQPWCVECDSEVGPAGWLDPCADKDQPGISLVIVGGESGPRARPMHPEWARSLRDQCQEASVAFHFKQWGEWGPDFPDDGDPEDGRNHPRETFWSDGTSQWRVGKKSAGRLLDGRIWDEMPEVWRV